MLGGYILINFDDTTNLYERLSTSKSKTIFIQYNNEVYAAKVDRGDSMVYISFVSYENTNCYFNCLTVNQSNHVDTVKKKIMTEE